MGGDGDELALDRESHRRNERRGPARSLGVERAANWGGLRADGTLSAPAAKREAGFGRSLLWLITYMQRDRRFPSTINTRIDAV